MVKRSWSEIRAARLQEVKKEADSLIKLCGYVRNVMIMQLISQIKTKGGKRQKILMAFKRN